MHDAIRPSLVIAAIVLASAVSVSVDPPELRINPTSELIETVDATWSGSNFNVRHTQITTSGEKETSILLTTNSANDLDPRIEIAPSGNVVVVWWRDLSVDKLVYRKRDVATGVWGAERFAGATAESNSRPRILYVGDTAWVAYTIQNPKSRSIGVQIIDDTPEPIRSIIATTTYAGDLDVQLEAEAGHLWVTWIDSASLVGYSEYNFEGHFWSVPYRESYAGGTVAAARDRIRNRILGF
jgi:hypothetical protein